MKILRGIALGFWVTILSVCVSLVAVYYIASQTILSPTAVKGWLNDSGAYTSLTDIVAPNLMVSDQPVPEATSTISADMIQRAAKASIKPEMVKAKVEPIIDATYAWLDSKSPEIRYEISTTDITTGFLAALRAEVLAKAKTLPECSGYVAPEDIVTANCLPWYVSPEAATDAVMEYVSKQEAVRHMVITPETFSAKQKSGLSDHLPDFISYLWVAQLLAMPVFALVALWLILKRRGGGMIATASSLFTPGLTLLIIGLVLLVGGGISIESLVVESQFASIAGPLGKEITKDLASITLFVSAVLLLSALITGGLGFWWRKRSRAKSNSL